MHVVHMFFVFLVVYNFNFVVVERTA